MPTSNFCFDRKRKDGLNDHCKKCRKKYDTSKRGKYLVKYRVIQKQLYIYKILQSSKCIDCGDGRWQVLEFDHVKGIKKYNISAMYTLSLEKIKQEITKCEIRCANCHRMKTIKQLDLYKNKINKLLQVKPLAKNLNSGENNYGSKLTEHEVKKIKKEYIPGRKNKLTILEMAQKYGVSKGAINGIIRGHNWKHVR